MPFEEMEKKLQEWNAKNYKPLSETYIKTQIEWNKKQSKAFPPPNCEHPFYKEIGIYAPECERMKNPLRWVAMKLRHKK